MENKPVKADNFCIDTPIDMSYANENMGFPMPKFLDFLIKFEDTTMMSLLQQIKEAVEQRDFTTLKSVVHQMKGASSYIAASHIHYTCYFIQFHYEAKKYHRMLAYYPRLIEACVQYRIFYRELLNKHDRKC